MKNLFAFLLILFLSFSIYSQSNTASGRIGFDESKSPAENLSKIVRQPVTIPQFSVAPIIDGKVDEEIWKQAAVFKDFIQTYPGNNIAPSKPTEVYLAYDEKHFYVAFKCWDEKDKIHSKIVQRDNVFGEDSVRFWLDTYGDQRRAYVFWFNPLGIQQDGIYTEGQGADFSVDIAMESKGVIESWGWSVEVKIPFKSLRYSAGKGKLWGFNVARNIDRLNGEIDSWVPLPRGVPGFLNKFGKIAVLDEMKKEAQKDSATSSPTTNKRNLPPEKTNPAKIVKFSSAPVIDGKLDDEIWKSATLLKDFVQTQPGDNIPASKQTEAMIGYDERNLYIAYKCYDERSGIRATVAKRDDLFNEDVVRLWLDTYDDQRRAYVFWFNPLGIQQDGIYTEGQGADFSVDVVMESKGVIEDWGWSVEVKIPFKSLRYTAGKGKNWGFNVARTIQRLNQEFDMWVPHSRNISGFLPQHGKLTGLDEIKAERTLEIVPSITVSETGERKSDGRFVNAPIKQDISLGLKYTITPNLTLDFAYNPDFAEIEADAPVVSANQRFPIFFQEKRPFFLEGADIFQTPIQVFYSRKIIDPDFAAKLTGKLGKNTIGFLVASDKAPGNFSEDDRNDPTTRATFGELFDKNSLIGAFRVKRDFGKENNIGIFATTYIFPEKRNHTFGIDARIKLDDKTTISFQTVGSNSKRCFFNNAFDPVTNLVAANRNQAICQSSRERGASQENFYRSGNGFAYSVNYDYTGRNRGWLVEASGSTRDYRAEVGFTRRTNTNSIFAGGRISTESKPKASLIRFDWFNGAGLNFDWNGRLTNVNYSSNFNFNLQKNTFIHAEIGIGYDRIFEEEFGRKRLPTRPIGAFFGSPERSTVNGYVGAFVNKNFNKQLYLEGFLFYNFNQFDFDFGAGPRYPRVSPAALANPNNPLDPGSGNQLDMGLVINLKPTDPLRISLDYNKSILTRNDTGLTAFDTDIFSLKSTYQFTRFIFIRTRLDYDTLSRNASGQLLFGWNPSPGKAFYVGYNDNSEYPPFIRNQRTFFIRMSYLFRRSF